MLPAYLKLIISISFFSLLFYGSSDAAKIFLLPLAHGSHILNFMQIGNALAERGHELHTALNEDCSSTKKLTEIGVINHGYRIPCLVENEKLKERQKKFLVNGFSLAMLSEIPDITRLFNEEYEALFDDQLIATLKDEDFDIAILDAIVFTRPIYILPYRLGIPTISIAAVTGLLDTGIPALPSFTPWIRFGKLSNKMTFSERVYNTLQTLLVDRMTAYILGQTNAVSKYAPQMPYKTLSELQAGSALWLIMNDGAMDYPQVSLPHVINVGGINTGPAKPLEGDFQTIADGAEGGLVIVSFGSMLSDFPTVLRKRLYNDLKQLKETLIWRYTSEIPDDLPSNMHLVKWMPQNDLLAHPNTKVFVTHCGCNGQFEALYNGVPMVGIPVFADQVYNAVRMVQKGMGIQVDLHGFKPGELRSAIHEVMHNQSYTKAMKKWSAIFRSQPMKPVERAVFWIEHVLEYGYDHLHTPGINMPWYQYWCIDVLIFIIMVVSILVSLFVVTMFFLISKCRACLINGSRRPSTTNEKKKL